MNRTDITDVIENQDDSAFKEPVFDDRSPENIEKFIELAEGFQSEESTAGTEAREGVEERLLRESQEFMEGFDNNLFFSTPSAAFEVEEEGSAPAILNNHFSESQEKAARARTANRLKYEAEVEVIKKQIGDLEEIRTKLGLSRRKMCQLLMVDPSAWTRWTKEGAPPYVYRALEWYMLLHKEVPHHAHSYWLATVGARLRNTEDHTPKIHRLSSETMLLDEQIQDLRIRLDEVSRKSLKLQKNNRLLMVIITLISLALVAEAAVTIFFSR